MSLAYREAVQKNKKVNMRKWCQRPGARDKKTGKILYFTEQSHKAMCDVNNIVAKYDKTGIITHVQKIEARFGDVTGLEFRRAQDIYVNAQAMFDNLPANIKKRFNQNAGELLAFMENEENREEAIELGLIKRETPPEKDGLGEHVKADDYVEEKVKEEKVKAETA